MKEKSNAAFMAEQDLSIREEKARENSLYRLNQGGKRALVAIKAQHPLNSDGTPGEEYEQRLQEALKVADYLKEKGLKVVFMTFGGVHEGHETITLAESGATWLKTYGISADDIVVSPVVFSGNDEDRIAAEYFESHPEFSELHVVLSIAQIARAHLYFIRMGWQPFVHPITFLAEKPHHSLAYELTRGIEPFFIDGGKAVDAMTEEIRRRHKSEAH